MSKENYYIYSEDSEGIEVRAIIDRYLKFWPWFVMSIGVCLFFGLLYLTFAKSSYKAVATIIIEGEKSKGPTSGNGFADLTLLSGFSTSSIENELGLLRSKRLMYNAVKALNLNVQYLNRNDFFTKEYYKNSPYNINIVRLDDALLKKASELEENKFTINYLTDDEVEVSFENDKESIINKIGDVVELDYIQFFIEKNGGFNIQIEDSQESIKVEVIVSGMQSVASSIGTNLNVDLVDKNSTMIALTLVDKIPSKAEDVLNQLIFEYNKEAIEDKDLIARNTAFFIDERLAIINSELDSVETGKEQFKESNLLTNIEAESQLIVKNVSDYNNEQQRIGTELELTSALIEHLKNNKTSLLPANIGIDDSGLSSLIEEFNSNVLERDRLLKSASEQNPIVLGLNNQIEQIRDNVMESLIGMQSSLKIKKNNLDRQSGVLASQISDVPAQERAYRGIERQQNIKEALYLFLLQKREENSLSLAASAPKAKIVDNAYALSAPVSPKSKNVIIMAFFAGLLLPFMTLNAIWLLNDKLLNSDDVKRLAKELVFLGELPHVLPKQSSVIDSNTRTVLSESFNILTSGVQHYAEKKNPLGKSMCIFITSSVKGEGKTFTSVNLGVTLASEGKKVIVIGGDLRNPQLHRYQNKANYKIGLSTYLNDTSLMLQDYIQNTDIHNNLKFMYTGAIPNNPIELLKKTKMEQMFQELKNEFDYIIVDTAPVLHLADTFVISKYADLTLFVLRASVTKKSFVGLAEEMEKSGKLKNVGLVINDVKLKDTSYGYGYDYGT
tara:strand:+ start:14004 stop:16355 length:2352 start_codon:yes stop_codon:yes gene_type:complete